MYAIIDKKMVIVCLEYDAGGVVGSVCNKIKVIVASQLIDLKATPN